MSLYRSHLRRYLHPPSHTAAATSLFADTVPVIDFLAEETHSTAGAKAVPACKSNLADLDLSCAVKTSMPWMQQESLSPRELENQKRFPLLVCNFDAGRTDRTSSEVEVTPLFPPSKFHLHMFLCIVGGLVGYFCRLFVGFLFCFVCWWGFFPPNVLVYFFSLMQQNKPLTWVNH